MIGSPNWSPIVIFMERISRCGSAEDSLCEPLNCVFAYCNELIPSLLLSMKQQDESQYHQIKGHGLGS